MKKDVTLSNRVQIANLPRENEDCKGFGKTMVISGWGADAYGGRPSGKNNTLWTVKQQCLVDSKCDGNGRVFKGDVMVCAGDKAEPNNSACHGDYGGMNEFISLSKDKCHFLCNPI